QSGLLRRLVTGEGQAVSQGIGRAVGHTHVAISVGVSSAPVLHYQTHRAFSWSSMLFLSSRSPFLGSRVWRSRLARTLIVLRFLLRIFCDIQPRRDEYFLRSSLAPSVLGLCKPCSGKDGQ